MFEVVHVADGDLHDEAFAAGDAVALKDFWHLASDAGEVGEAVSGDGDFDEGTHVQAEGDGVDLGPVAQDDFGLFEAVHAVDDRGCGEVDAAGELGEGDACVVLEFFDEGEIDAVE